MGRGRTGWRWIAEVLNAIASDRPILLLLVFAMAMLAIVVLALTH